MAFLTRASSASVSTGVSELETSVTTQEVQDAALNMRDSRFRAVLIAGPTASGKSALALALAEELRGTIINADSMQVYRDLRVITARPAPDEEARAPHRLYGHVDAAENYSVGRWCVDARVAQSEAMRERRRPIVVGGTGLYFKTLTQGLAAIPPIPADVRSAVRGRLAGEGVAALYAELAERDPTTAQRLMPGDRARITRALEVVLATGRSLTDWHRDGMKPALDPVQAVKLFLEVERAELYRRIDARFDAMLASGALDEVRALERRALDPALPAMKAHGVPWLIRHLNGEIGLDEAAAEAKRDTRRYTKRQATWFRHQLPDWTWISPDRAPGTVRRMLDR
jgi:tRNA dimethylallyltransferase